MTAPNGRKAENPAPVEPRDQAFRAGEKESRRQRRNFRTAEPTFVAHVADVPEPDGERREVLVCASRAPLQRELVELANAGWSVAADGHWPTLRRHGTTVRWLASWTSGALLEPDDARGLWQMLNAHAGRVAPGLRMIGAPGTTGRDAWLRLIPEGHAYPVLDAATAEFIRGTSGQGRIEVLPAPAPDAELELVVEYDARLAYLSVLEELPMGAPRWLDGPDARRWQAARPYGRGRYRCSWSAPVGERIGILPQHGTWPLEGDGTGWCDGAELALALRRGWSVHVHEALVWEQTCSPFRTWRERLTRVMNTPPRGADPGIWRAVWRSVALHTIGAMHGASRKVTRIAPASEAPDDRTVRMLGGGLVRWTELTPAVWPETHHPEWTACIWSRARARLLDAPAGRGAPRVGALNVPAETVIGFRTDAIYLSAPAHWPDDGALGRFRVKRSRTFDRPQPWPVDQTALLALIAPTEEA